MTKLSLEEKKKLDIRHCLCSQCGNQMLLVYEVSHQVYMAMCDACNIISELPGDPKWHQ
jgi:hypothetical protein